MQVSSFSLPIFKYKERVLKKVLNSLNSKNIVNLKLKNIVIVKGFYINIILIVLLHATSIQLYSLNNSLYYRTKGVNVVLVTLLIKYNILFLKYKLYSFYFSALFIVIPISLTSVFIYLTLKRSINKRFRRTQDYQQLRLNFTQLQYKKARYLRKKALKKFILRARNI